MGEKLNRYIQNTKGLTLVELLAGLTISLLILSLTLSLLTSTYNSFQQSKIQQQMQQEANLLITSISSFHQSGGFFSFNYNNNAEITLIRGSESRVLSSKDFEYSISIEDQLLAPDMPRIEITDKKFSVKIKIRDPDGTLHYDTSTLIEKL